MPARLVPTHLRLAVVSVLLGLAALGCSAEADLIAYFGTPGPSVQPTPTIPGATATPPAPTPPPSSAATTAPPPTPAPTPSPTDAPSATPAWSPMPTRPPSLPAFNELRTDADVTDVSRLSANPQRFVGSTVYFEGRVNGLIDSESGLRALVRIGDLFVILVYQPDRYWGDHPLVQGDRIRVVGEFLGMSGSDDSEPLPEIRPIDMQHRFT